MKNPLKFLQEVKQEAFRVTWPTKKDTVTGSLMVFVLATIAAIFFLLLDNRYAIPSIAKIPNIPLKTRLKIRNIHKKIGQKNFYKKLIKIDSHSKNRINPNDTQRMIRAYEIKKYTKTSLFEWFKKTKPIFKKEKFIKIYIDYSRVQLINRISRRVEEMIKMGAISEVKTYLKLKVRKENSSNKVIGVQEISELIKKKINLDQAKERISIKSRQYAKRQSTWARRYMSDWNKIDLNNVNISNLKKFFYNYLL